jgi:hypothetical protein
MSFDIKFKFPVLIQLKQETNVSVWTYDSCFALNPVAYVEIINIIYTSTGQSPWNYNMRSSSQNILHF